MLVPLTAACMAAAAKYYAVPAETLAAIRRIEGGVVGQVTQNTGRRRSQDLGPFQINTAWLRTFTLYWRTGGEGTTYRTLRDNGCANVAAAAAILRYYYQQTGNLDRAIGRYHAGPAGAPAEAAKYLAAYRFALANHRQPRWSAD